MYRIASKSEHLNSGPLKQLFYFCSLLFVVWEFVTFGVRDLQFFFSSSTGTEDVCHLDSFSEPSLASSILRQQSDRLLLSYTPHQQITTRAGTTQRLQIDNRSITKQIEELQHEVATLDSDLDRGLMIIYFDNHLWSEFLDRYLHLVHTEPQSANVLMWAWPALTCSKNCNRTDEVFAELKNLTQFHPTLKTISGLKAVLSEWASAENKPPKESALGGQSNATRFCRPTDAESPSPFAVTMQKQTTDGH